MKKQPSIGGLLSNAVLFARNRRTRSRARESVGKMGSPSIRAICPPSSAKALLRDSKLYWRGCPGGGVALGCIWLVPEPEFK
jgi:hypothetical protein